MLTPSQRRLTMSVTEVCQEMGISKPTGYDLVNQTNFPSIRLGKKIIIPREAFENWLQESVASGLAFIPTSKKTELRCRA